MKSIKLGQFLAVFSCLTILHSCGEGEFDSIKQAKNLRDDNGAKTGRWVEYIDEDGAIEDFYQVGVTERFRLITYEHGCPTQPIREYSIVDSSLVSSYKVLCKSPAMVGSPLVEIRDTTSFFENDRLSSISFNGDNGLFTESYHYKDSLTTTTRYDSSTVVFISSEIQPHYTELYNSIPWDIVNEHVDNEAIQMIDIAVKTSSYRVYYNNGATDTTGDLLEAEILPQLENLYSEAKKIEREIKNNPLYQSTICDCCNRQIRHLRDAYTAPGGDWGIQQVKSGLYLDFQIKMMMAFRPLLGGTFFCSPRCSNQCG